MALQKSVVYRLLAIVSGLLFSFRAVASSSIHLTSNVTPICGNLCELRQFIFLLCVAIVIVVFSVMFYALIKYRSTHDTAAQFHGSARSEMIWSIIPLFILILLALPAVITFIRFN